MTLFKTLDAGLVSYIQLAQFFLSSRVPISFLKTLDQDLMVVQCQNLIKNIENFDFGYLDG